MPLACSALLTERASMFSFSARSALTTAVLNLKPPAYPHAYCSSLLQKGPWVFQNCHFKLGATCLQLFDIADTPALYM
uniref:Uncharacterized protein n=1 Tax=Triticum urartu TaxID=4572 RepID=A0A8R7UCI8_TRIUA